MLTSVVAVVRFVLSGSTKRTKWNNPPFKT
jgi:hypothetical protein